MTALESEAIEKAVSLWLDQNNAMRACSSCAFGCNDLVRFICAGGSIADLYEILKEHKEFYN